MIFQKFRLINIISISVLFLILLLSPAPAQDENKGSGEAEDLVDFMEEGMKEIDFYSLEELLNVEVEVASLFAEDELVVGSSVSSISAHKWKELGARRMHEALNNEMGVYTNPNIAGIYNISIRGYTNSESDLGISTLIDGTPANLITLGMAFGGMPNFELGILERIEMIKGPGSSIYGSDAFHGVLLLKTFESDNDHYSAGISAACPLYGDANAKISQGLYDNLIRVDTAVSASHQGEQDIEYEYEDDTEEGTGSRDSTYNSMGGTFKVRINPFDKLKIKLGSYFTKFKCEEFPATYLGAFGYTRDNDHSANDAIYFIGSGLASYEFNNEISVETSGFYGYSDLEYSIATDPDSYATQFGLIEQSGGKITVKQPDNPLNLQWLVAYSYSQGKLKQNSAVLTTPAGDTDIELKAEGFERKINSVFSQIKWGAIEKRLYVLLGGRLDNYAAFGNEVTPRAGLIFLPTEKSSIKALYGRAFKAPNQVQLYGFPLIANGNEDLEPETIDVYELIYIFKTGNFKINLTGFYSYWSNAIIGIRPTPGALARYENKGENDSIGGEMNLFFSLDPFAIDLGFAYVSSRAIDARLKDENGDPVIINGEAATSDREYYAFPEYSINAGLHYILKPIDINFYLNNTIYLRMKESPYDVKPGAEYLPPYYRLDLNISKVVNDKFEAFLDIRNLLNRDNYRSGAFGQDNGIPESGISVMLRAGYKL